MDFGGNPFGGAAPAALPDEVARARAERPDCAYSVESATRINVVNGQARQSVTERYYQQCPGDRARRLLHAAERSTAGAADEVAAAGWGSGGGGGASGGGDDALAALFPSIDDFIRDFLGVRRGHGSGGDAAAGDLPWVGGGGGRIPFPFPLPRPQAPPQLRAQRDGAGGASDEDGGEQLYGWPQPQPQQPQPPPAAAASRGGPPSLAERERGRGVYV
jgi:hypothetical protein